MKTNAEEFLKRMETEGFNLKAPIDVDDILVRLGLRFGYDYTLKKNDLVASMVRQENGAWTIHLAPEATSYSARRREILAHLVGHYVLHVDESRAFFQETYKTLDHQQSFWVNEEFQANQFADHLLLPTGLALAETAAIIEDYEAKNKNQKLNEDDFIIEMMRRFNVPAGMCDRFLLRLNSMQDGRASGQQERKGDDMEIEHGSPTP